MRNIAGKKILLPLLGLSLALGSTLVLSTSLKKAESVNASVGNYSRTQSTYYTSAFTHKVTSSQYGSTLLSTLHELMFDSHQSYNTYDDLWTYTKNTDYDIDNPDNIILLYSRQSIDGTATASSWNREHVWCKSLSGGLYTSVSSSTTGAGSDLHHLRPASTAYNSSRGNIPYGVVASHNSSTQFGSTDCYKTTTSFEPADYLKGDVARVLMYTYVHYSSEVGGTSTKTGSLSITNIVNESSTQNAWDLLMNWNETDPVDYQEMIRNNECARLLGNYNPFIDHPEFARMIWDDESTYQAGLFFQNSYKTVSVGSSYTNTASAWGNVTSSGSVVYTSDNPSVASVNSSTGQVTGVSNGVARIKARTTINGIQKISYHFVVVGSGYTPKYNLNANGIVYTPTSKSTAIASEQISSETVSFSNTYETDKYHTQITSGKKMTLTITNFPKTISSIILYMHSNASKGKGSISITVGGSTYKSISDSSFASIYGIYSESYVPVDVTNSSASKKTGTIVITINCSENSLFLQKVVIDYSERSVTKATSIGVTPSSIQMTPGEDNYLATSYSPSSTTLQECTWVSSNTSVATVNRYGLVRAISLGTATITATSTDGNGATGTATINVVNDVTPSGTVTGVTVSPSSTSLDVYNNDTKTLSATVNGTGNPSQAVTWSVYSSSPSGCVSVNSSGVVTAVAAGSAVVRATSDADSTHYGSCNITITDSTPTLSSISVSTAPTKTTYTAGEYFDPTGLVIRRNFSNSTNDTYTYANHEGAFTFSPTTSTALTTSNTSVTITYGGKSTSQAITVNENSGGSGDEFTGTYNYSNKGTTWSLSDCEDKSSYWLCPATGTESIALIEGIFTDKSITSDVVITINSATYGNGNTPTDATYAIYNSSACTSEVSATQTGTLPTSSTYTNVVYTVALINVSSFSDDLAIKITKPGRQIRLKSITVEFDYETSSSVTPTISWTAPTISVFSGAILSGSDVNSWAVTYDDGTGSTTTPSYNQLTVKLDGATISIPHTWVAADDGKTLTATYNSLTTTPSSAVEVVQTVNNIYADAVTSNTKTWTAASGDLGTTISTVGNTATGSVTFDDSTTMSFTRTLEFVASGKSDYVAFTNNYIQFGSSNALETLELIAVTSGTVTSVVVDCWSKNGGSNISVTVGGNTFDSSQSCPSAGAEVTFSGSATGTVVITMEKSTKTAGLAQYIKSVAITTQTSGGSTQIANNASHKAAQKLAVLFAKTFNEFMDDTKYCTTGLDAAWASCSTAYTLFKQSAASLGETEEAWCLNLIKYATAQYSNDSGEACIERMMKTYEICVQKHGQTAFMSDLVTLGSPKVSPLLSVVSQNTNIIAVIVIISMVSVTAIGGYFFLRKRKEI